MSTAVRVSMFYTRNLGNFENVKIGYELETDEMRNGESIDQFKERLEKKVNAWVNEAVTQIDAEAK